MTNSNVGKQTLLYDDDRKYKMQKKTNLHPISIRLKKPLLAPPKSN